MRNIEGNWSTRPRRLHRKNIFKDSGFLKFEQESFSNLPLNIPYAKIMRKERLQLYNQAKANEWTATQYRQAVEWQYESRGILRVGDWKGYAFALLRWYEANWIKTADPNDPYFKNKTTRSHHGSKELIDRDKVLESKRLYRKTHADEIRAYKHSHRQQTNEARRIRDQFKKNQGQ